MRRNIKDLGDEPIDFLMSRSGVREPEPKTPKRKTKITPHERGRSMRKVTLTLPSSEWKDAIIAEAERWGVRNSDLMTYAISYLMRAIEDGDVQRPGDSSQFYHRSAEMLLLPWEPE